MYANNILPTQYISVNFYYTKSLSGITIANIYIIALIIAALFELINYII